MMTRNLDKRVEILFPVFEGLLKKRIKTTLSLLLSDNVKARLQNSIGEYDYVKRLQDQPMIDSQKLLYEMLNVVSEDEE